MEHQIVMKILGIIPARYDSSRFPGKPLLDLGGKSMVKRVYEQAQKSKLDQVIVATDDERIYNAVLNFGGKAIMTSSEHPSGTDRCLEALQKSEGNFDGVINIQVDEPFIHPEQIQKIAHCLQQKNTQIATLGKVVSRKEDVLDVNAPKVFFNEKMLATTFEREVDFDNNTQYYHHVGIYGYTSKALTEITQLPPSKNEIKKQLEQLRWLDNGYSIRVELTEHKSFSIDTPEDVKKIAHLL
tara:strand:- start:1282 stop:2004 length:723 start_codon:yes stop_codon:yes gene_type:complete